MTIIHHPLALEDADEIRCYLEQISDRLPDQFDHELEDVIQKALENPHHFHPVPQDTRIRRANMKRMNYNVLYACREDEGVIYILTVRHDKRHPDYGLDRI